MSTAPAAARPGNGLLSSGINPGITLPAITARNRGKPKKILDTTDKKRGK